MIRVLDASVVVEWFASRDQATAARADVLLDEVASSPRGFVVPSLLFHEVHAVLCRKLARSDDVAQAMDLIRRLSLPIMPFDEAVARLATDLAKHNRLSGYDATYVATAQLCNGEWITLDEPAHRRVQHLKLSALL